ncbi:MAG: HAMP domain-containing sensor histidine kinase [Actinomycetota bacterium]
MERGGWWRSLLARVTIAYAVGSLLLTTTVAFATFELTQSRLLSDAQSQHLEQFKNNVTDVRLRFQALPEDPEDIELVYGDLLAQLSTPNGSQPLLSPSPEQFRGRGGVSEDDLPTNIRARIQLTDLEVLQQRYTRNGEPRYVLAVNLGDQGVAYYEFVSLADVDATLQSLRLILVGVAVGAGLLGALLGWYAARSALAPLPRISNAALAIAEGDLDTKIEFQADRDLATLSEAFNYMVEAVRERIEREQRFTSDVSHELRSPLMTLTASVEVLERRSESLPDVAQQAVELLSQDLERFQRLVEDLLEISRLEAGAVQLQLSRFRLAEFLDNVVRGERHQNVVVHHPPRGDTISITADKRRLAQVMTNLIQNAKKYGDGDVEVSFEAVGEDIHIAVEDSGPGVPFEQRERIFERFGRIGSSAGNRAIETGFGLGLSLVAEHVRIHGGTVRVTDRIDGQHGARFVVQLPLGEHVDVVEEMAE